MELDQARKQDIMPIVNNSHWDNFIACVKVAEKDLYVIQFEFYIKVAYIVGIFFKFQEYVDEGKHCQEEIEEFKCMVKDISVFQENCPEVFSRILEMSSHDKDCYIEACDRCAKRGKLFESNFSKVCMECAKVDDYIYKIVKELNLPPLVVGNQILSHDQLKAKLKHGHLKRMVELSKLEELVDVMLEKFVVNPTKATTRL